MNNCLVQRDARCFRDVVCGLIVGIFLRRPAYRGSQHDSRSRRWRASRRESMEYLDVRPFAGVPMPRYLTQHTLACLTRQGAEALAQRLKAGGRAHAERVLVNLLEGKMFVEFRANSREDLEAWLETEGIHFDFLVRIEWEMQGDRLQVAE